ncbi:MAG TPA: trehalase-like domain-containing protein, partial [Candidatus Binataceae bacterium]|nr:trehalase-like domain-containing protein [Candidatus Binataceae bacterium]
MALKIEDYALIGNCKTAALVGLDGSIDWLTWPRFDSAACFAALLGSAENGRWLLAPTSAPRSVTRCYRQGTLVLETQFETPTGTAVLVDFMPPDDPAAEVVRIVIGREGEVAFRTELLFRLDYGTTVPWVIRTEDGDI